MSLLFFLPSPFSFCQKTLKSKQHLYIYQMFIEYLLCTGQCKCDNRNFIIGSFGKSHMIMFENRK